MASAGGVRRPTGGVDPARCNCCPYGFHIDTDFIDFAENVSRGAAANNGAARQAPPQQQRHASTTPRNMAAHGPRAAGESHYYGIPKMNKLPMTNGIGNGIGARAAVRSLERRKGDAGADRLGAFSPMESVFSDSLENIMSDFEETLSNAKGRLNGTTSRKPAIPPPPTAALPKPPVQHMSTGAGVKSTRMESNVLQRSGYTSDCGYAVPGRPPIAQLTASVHPTQSTGRPVEPKPAVAPRISMSTSTSAARPASLFTGGNSGGNRSLSCDYNSERQLQQHDAPDAGQLQQRQQVQPQMASRRHADLLDEKRRLMEELGAVQTQVNDEKWRGRQLHQQRFGASAPTTPEPHRAARALADTVAAPPTDSTVMIARKIYNATTHINKSGQATTSTVSMEVDPRPAVAIQQVPWRRTASTSGSAAQQEPQRQPMDRDRTSEPPSLPPKRATSASRLHQRPAADLPPMPVLVRSPSGTTLNVDGFHSVRRAGGSRHNSPQTSARATPVQDYTSDNESIERGRTVERLSSLRRSKQILAMTPSFSVSPGRRLDYAQSFTATRGNVYDSTMSDAEEYASGLGVPADVSPIVDSKRKTIGTANKRFVDPTDPSILSDSEFGGVIIPSYGAPSLGNKKAAKNASNESFKEQICKWRQQFQEVVQISQQLEPSALNAAVNTSSNRYQWENAAPARTKQMQDTSVNGDMANLQSVSREVDLEPRAVTAAQLEIKSKCMKCDSGAKSKRSVSVGVGTPPVTPPKKVSCTECADLKNKLAEREQRLKFSRATATDGSEDVYMPSVSTNTNYTHKRDAESLANIQLPKPPVSHRGVDAPRAIMYTFGTMTDAIAQEKKSSSTTTERITQHDKCLTTDLDMAQLLALADAGAKQGQRPLTSNAAVQTVPAPMLDQTSHTFDLIQYTDAGCSTDVHSRDNCSMTNDVIVREPPLLRTVGCCTDRLNARHAAANTEPQPQLVSRAVLANVPLATCSVFSQCETTDERRAMCDAAIQTEAFEVHSAPRTAEPPPHRHTTMTVSGEDEVDELWLMPRANAAGVAQATQAATLSTASGEESVDGVLTRHVGAGISTVSEQALPTCSRCLATIDGTQSETLECDTGREDVDTPDNRTVTLGSPSSDRELSHPNVAGSSASPDSGTYNESACSVPDEPVPTAVAAATEPDGDATVQQQASVVAGEQTVELSRNDRPIESHGYYFAEEDCDDDAAGIEGEDYMLPEPKKVNFRKPRGTRAYELSRAAALKKLLTSEQSSPAIKKSSSKEEHFQRGTQASKSLRHTTQKGDSLEYITDKKDKQMKVSTLKNAPGKQMQVKPDEGLKDKVSIKKAPARPTAPPPAPVPARIPRPKVTKYAAPAPKHETPEEAEEAADELAPLRSELRELRPAHVPAVGEGVSPPRGLPRTSTDSQNSDGDSDSPDEGSYDTNNAVAVDKAQSNSEDERLEIDGPLTDSIEWLAAGDTIEKKKQIWARQFMQHEWLKTSARQKSSARRVELFMNALSARSEDLLRTVVNMSDTNGNTALHYAVSHSNWDVVSLLLDGNVCRLDMPNRAGYTPVMLAALCPIAGHTEQMVMERLFHMGHVNVRAKQHGQTALMLAVSHGRLATAQLLVESGAELNLQDEDGSTALMCAAEHGHKDVVKWLLSLQHIDATVADYDGSTALSIAIENGHRDVGVLIYAHLNYGKAPAARLSADLEQALDGPEVQC